MAPLPSTARASISSIAKLTYRPTSTNLVRRAIHYSSLALHQLKKRQDIVAIPTTYGDLNSGPSPGKIVGIVLGSVAGFLLLLWLLYTCFNFGGVGRASTVTTEIVRERRPRKSRASRASHSRSRSRRGRVSETVERVTEVIETRRPSPMMAPPPPAPVPMERVIVEERRESRTESRPPPLRRIGSDEVVVIEEHSPPRRKSSRRRERERVSGGYRPVDPMAYAGGSAPMREMSRKSSSRISRG